MFGARTMNAMDPDQLRTELTPNSHGARRPCTPCLLTFCQSQTKDQGHVPLVALRPLSDVPGRQGCGQ